MNTLKLEFIFDDNDRLGLKSIVFDENNTKLPSDSTTLFKIAVVMLEALRINKEDVAVQDLLNELNLKRGE